MSRRVHAWIGLVVGLLASAAPARACPEDEQVSGQPLTYVQEGRIWELRVPSALVKSWDEPATQAHLNEHVPASQLESLRQGRPHLKLMDEIGRQQGVVIVGIGARGPSVVMPSGRSPYERLRAVQTAAGSVPLEGWATLTPLIAQLPEAARPAYAEALAALMPGRSALREGEPAGKLIAGDCNIGPTERMFMVLLADGRVGFVSPAGVLGYAEEREGHVAADRPRLGALERWRLERHDRYTVSLKSARATYLHWGGRSHLELDASAPHVETARMFHENQERFFLWANADGTVTLKLPNNRVSVSIVPWALTRSGLGSECHYYGYRQDPTPGAPQQLVSVSLGSGG